MAPTTLILVRHGETDSNIRGLLHGQTDVPLTARGLAQARLVAARLGLEPDIAALYASPLQRAWRTAELIGAAIGRAPVAVPGLMEIDFGLVEGLTYEEALARHPELRLAERNAAEDDDLQWPRGESRNGFHRRVSATLRDLLAQHDGEKIVVAAHGGVISRGLTDLLGEAGASWRRYQVANCAVTQLVWRAGAVEIACLDDQTHLADLPPAEPAGATD